MFNFFEKLGKSVGEGFNSVDTGLSERVNILKGDPTTTTPTSIREEIQARFSEWRKPSASSQYWGAKRASTNEVWGQIRYRPGQLYDILIDSTSSWTAGTAGNITQKVSQILPFTTSVAFGGKTKSTLNLDAINTDQAYYNGKKFRESRFSQFLEGMRQIAAGTIVGDQSGVLYPFEKTIDFLRSGNKIKTIKDFRLSKGVQSVTDWTINSTFKTTVGFKNVIVGGAATPFQILAMPLDKLTNLLSRFISRG